MTKTLASKWKKKHFQSFAFKKWHGVSKFWPPKKSERVSKNYILKRWREYLKISFKGKKKCAQNFSSKSEKECVQNFTFKGEKLSSCKLNPKGCSQIFYLVDFSQACFLSLWHWIHLRAWLDDDFNGRPRLRFACYSIVSFSKSFVMVS
jgi:hypothetical protein